MYFKHHHPRRGEIVEVAFPSGPQQGKIIWIYGDDQLYLLEFYDPKYYKSVRYDIIDSSIIKTLG